MRPATQQDDVTVDFSCRICLAADLREMVRPSYYLSRPSQSPVYRCRQCGAISAPAADAQYADAYYESYDDFIPGTQAHNARIALFRERVLYLAGQVGGGRILDIGCARGDFLDQAAECGFETYGLEVSPDAAARAVQRGHQVVNAQAEHLPYVPASFSAVHMNHVLEHVEAPVDALRSIRSALKPGGLAIIEVPNEIGPLAVQIKLLAGRLGTPGTERLRFAPHVTFFNMRTLKLACRMAGLRIVRRRTMFAGPITPMLRTIPAMIARVYDRAFTNGDTIEVVVTLA